MDNRSGQNDRAGQESRAAFDDREKAGGPAKLWPVGNEIYGAVLYPKKI
jgi:hypothetical protein